jgi:hypothetical protein
LLRDSELIVLGHLITLFFSLRLVGGIEESKHIETGASRVSAGLVGQPGEIYVGFITAGI